METKSPSDLLVEHIDIFPEKEHFQSWIVISIIYLFIVVIQTQLKN